MPVDDMQGIAQCRVEHGVFAKMTGDVLFKERYPLLRISFFGKSLGNYPGIRIFENVV